MMMMMFAHNNTTIIQNHTHTKCMITTTSASSISCYSPFLHFNNNNNKTKKKNKFHRCCVSSSSSVASPPQSIISQKPSAAEVARTIMELSSVGTLSSIITNLEQQQLSCVGVRFAVDPEDGSPIVSLNPNHSPSSSINNNSTLNVQLEQCGGLRTTQCTIHASLHPPSTPIHLNKLQSLWEKRFREKANSNFIHILRVQRVLQLDNFFTQDGVWISSHEYTIANPDPLRDCAHRLVHGFNTDNREDVLRFCNIYVDSHVQVSDAKMVWLDRLGFDVHLYSPDNDVFEVRIPFPREVTNEKGAKSSFNGMAQQAWEVEKNYHALEFQKATQLNRIASKLQ